jgi:hypothetical protein
MIQATFQGTATSLRAFHVHKHVTLAKSLRLTSLKFTKPQSSMKKVFFAFFFMVVSLALVSCDDDDQVNDGSFNNALTISSSDLQGTWKIKEYRDDDDDDNIAPALLQLVTIEFTSDNRVIGYLSGIKFGEGNWSITRQSRVLKLDLDDDDDFLFDDLENEWYISSRTATQITLLEYDDDDDDDDDQAKLVLELVR